MPNAVILKDRLFALYSHVIIESFLGGNYVVSAEKRKVDD